MPVPAGISLPMMTFSLRPMSWSLLPSIAASVSTRVVSWKEAADSQDSVASDALVMPSSSGRPLAGVPPRSSASWLARSKVARSTSSPGSRPVSPRGPDAEHPQHLLGVGHTVDDGLADVDLLAVLDPQARAARHDRLPLLALVRGDRHLDALVDLLDGGAARELGDRRHALRRARLEQLLDARQTVGDVLAGDTTGVEGPHGELRARLADRLGGDDADRLADVDQPVGGQAAAVAELADPDQRLAGQHRTAQDLLDPVLDQHVHNVLVELGPALEEDLAGLGVLDVLGERPRERLGLDLARAHVVVLALGAWPRPLHRDDDLDAALGAA